MRNHIRKAFCREFGFDASLTYDEFGRKLGRVKQLYWRDPQYPSIQVASDSSFRWNPEIFRQRYNQLWGEYVDMLAQKHLSQQDFCLWCKRH